MAVQVKLFREKRKNLRLSTEKVKFSADISLFSIDYAIHKQKGKAFL